MPWTTVFVLQINTVTGVSAKECGKKINSLYSCLKKKKIQHFDGLVQGFSISSANALEILKPCIKPLNW